MNFGDAKSRAIKLINEYSNKGALIPAGNNKDYTLRMPSLADDAQQEIADRVSIDASTEFDQTKSTERGYNEYDLPADFRSIRYVRKDDCLFYDYDIEAGKIRINKRYGGTFTVFYAKNPATIADDVADDFEFEVDSYTHRWIPYYLGGMVIADESTEISNKLLNIYYEGIGNLVKQSRPGPRTVSNTMGW